MSLVYGPLARRHPPTLTELVPLLEAACGAWREQPTSAKAAALFEACFDVAAVVVLSEEGITPYDVERTDRLVARLYGGDDD